MMVMVMVVVGLLLSSELTVPRSGSWEWWSMGPRQPKMGSVIVDHGSVRMSRNELVPWVAVPVPASD